MKSAIETLSTRGLKAIHPDKLPPLEEIRGAADFVFLPENKDSRYLVGFAISPKGTEQAFRLRYEVFNLELGEGLSDSHATGLDRDEFDDQMSHLVLVERATGSVIGTYRLQTVRQALSARGIYSAQEFDLGPLEPSFDRLTECGRACIAEGHRNFRTVYLLWAGIAAFLNLYSQSHLFGCCSLTSIDPDDGWRAMKTVRRKGHLHPDLRLSALPQCSCGPADREHSPEIGPEIPLPKLFKAYMSLGAKVVSEPAIDRQFKTVDFLVLLDTHRVHMSSLDLVK